MLKKAQFKRQAITLKQITSSCATRNSKVAKRFVATSAPPQQEASAPSKIIDFEDNKTIYATRSTPQLMRSFSTLKSCQLPFVAKLGAPILEHGGPVARFVARKTYFDFFCAGESLSGKDADQIAQTITQNYKEGLCTILDYSVEGSPPVRVDNDEAAPISASAKQFNESRCDEIAQGVRGSITFGAKMNQGANQKCVYGVVKVTGITNTFIMQRLSEIIQYVSTKPSEQKLIPEIVRVEGYVQTRCPAFNIKEAPKPFSNGELAQLTRIVQRLDEICKTAVASNMPLFIDAEQTYFQAAIDQLFMVMALKYNSKSAQDADKKLPPVYNTYQMYLTDSYDRLKYDIEFLTQRGYNMGVKLVRGAYMKTETARANELNLPNPIHKGIQNTHNCYEAGVQLTLKHLQHTGLLIASHNQTTIERAANWMVNDYHLERKDSRVHFAQLYGMGDSLSLGLARAGFNVSKYVPYGPLKEVMPYLSRRLIENSDIMGHASLELARQLRELKRRLKQ